MKEGISDIFKTDLKSYISIGDKIKVEVKEGYYRGFYLSRVEDVSDVIKIALPTDEKGRYVMLEKFTPIFISYFINKKRLGFNSKNIGRVVENGFKLLIVSFPDEIFRIEDREFFRINVNVSTNLLYYDKDIKCLIVDISGGGVLVRSKLKMGKGDMIKVFIPPLEMSMPVKVARKSISNEGQMAEYGCSFVNIKESTRDKIIRYCFNESIKQRKLINV
ncbi:MAG: hypothetical protein GXP60_06910 [Epsilonproteobacteria bacterium]|nr:hypothetical protein [Campylobacterota bacterium]